MPISAKLRSASTVMAWLSLSGAVVMTIAPPLAFLIPNPMIDLGGRGKFGVFQDGVTAATPVVWRAAALAAEAVPLALLVFALVQLFRLFRFYAAGKVFTAEPVSCLKQISTAMFWLVPATVLGDSASQYLLHLPLHQLWVAFKMDMPTWGLLFLAGVALVISHVMAEAQKLADENAKFV
ncbi:MAG: DUF2975 domain-containing protein [Rhizomicrobium sp.]|nr:DUF2975 domain-containing protein [Rhizomicrobium sp.]